MYVHNVEKDSSSYKYKNVANMYSMMLSCFWLKLISMPLFTVCAVTHTQTSSVTVFDTEGSSPCACTVVSCVGQSCTNIIKERTVLVHRKKYQKSAKHAI